MKNLSKLIIIGVFVLFTLGLFIIQTHTRITTNVLAQTDPQPTPPVTNANVNTVTNADVNANVDADANFNADPNFNAVTDANLMTTDVNTNANVANANTDAGNASDKKIPKNFTLGQDSFSEHGEVAFNHETHAFQKYSPDGKAVVGCVECHHTDQPKSALKPPLVTSERDVILTLATWQKSSQKVTECRTCHFQDGEVPDDKEMPTVGDKELNNEIAYHINCNTCHDAAAEARPEVKKNKGFATTNDCMICHKEN